MRTPLNVRLLHRVSHEVGVRVEEQPAFATPVACQRAVAAEPVAVAHANAGAVPGDGM
jgi:peptidoglycan/LPS O-acetylase OafA/YrhL